MNATATAPKSLVAKLAEVMAAVERVPKNGRNTFHKYDYATEADIVAVVRKELAQRHVMLVPSVQGYERHDAVDVTLLRMTFSFIDGESDQRIDIEWMGSGQDKGDKGVYKAMTGGLKYVLLKMFLIPTGDDPEAAEDAPAPAPPPQSYRQPAQPREVVNKQTGEITDAGHLTIRDVSVKEGTSARGKWTKYTIHFSDGSKATTLDRKMGEAAQKAKASGATVRPLTKQGNYGTELEALDVVAALASAMAPATKGMPEEPPGFMDVPDDDIPF